MDIRRQVEKFINEKAMPPTLFGRLAVRDPRIIFDMRNGRQVGARVEARLRDFMAGYPSAALGQRK